MFETGAICVAPENKPFWYTSGTIGPYYSNTQNLIGSETEANKLLAMIDSELDGDRSLLPARIERYFYDAYKKNDCYRKIADCIAECVNDNLDVDAIDMVSGGARRDWFFSFITARLFNKPHLTIYKDLEMALSEPFGVDSAAGAATIIRDGALAGKRCLHVSDIVTEASSYTRAWSPAVTGAGARIQTSLTILDRKQGGGEALAALGIRHLSLAILDAAFFDRALEQGYINERQHALLRGYIADPHASMRAFLHEHPEFLRDALNAGGKEAARARACLESGVYGDGLV